MVKLPLEHAKRLILASQGLTETLQSPRQIIEHLGYVQIDTISVIERAHHHVLWTRNQRYRPEDLADLVENRKVFEYWSHAASYLPMRDYRYTLPQKRAFRLRETSWYPRDVSLMKRVLHRIKREGPLRSLDFKDLKRGKTGWWDWKPAKKALERLFLEGKLEVTRREGFQKVYDLPERVIPSTVDTSLPRRSDYIRFLVERALRHHGLVTAAEVAYLRRSPMKQSVDKTLSEMAADREVVAVKIAGVDETYYARPATLECSYQIGARVQILSPFDNLVIQRKKLAAFFGFDFQIECYLPASKRQYGYFSLPILYANRFVGRVDCRADRKNSCLEVLALHYEKGASSHTLHKKLVSKLTAFADFNACRHVIGLPDC